MGRPRAKVASGDSTKNALSNSTTRSGPASGAILKVKSPVEADSASILEGEEHQALVPELKLGQDPWSPMMGDFEVAYDDAFAGSSALRSADTSMDYLLDDAPMDINDTSAHSTSGNFLEDTSSLDNSHRSNAVFLAQDLVSPDMLINRIGSPLAVICSSFQQRSVQDCAQYQGTASEQSSGLDSASGSSAASAPLADMLEFELTPNVDSGYASQLTGDSGESSRYTTHSHLSVYPHTLANPARGAFGCGQDSRLPTEGQSLVLLAKHAQLNYPSAVLKQLASLEAEQQRTKTLQIDRALVLESEVQESLSRLHHFKGSSQNGHLYLLELVSIKMMLDLLQKAAHGDFVVRPKQNHGPVLYIGGFKVKPKVRCIFLRKMLQARLYKLASLVRERENNVNGPRQDGFAMAGTVLLGDISRGLRTFMGLVEVWSSRQL
jgi:hypothetical protein